MTVTIDRHDSVMTVTIARPEVRNAVDRQTAESLEAAFVQFEADDGLDVAILTGADGHFCAGADLHALGDPQRRNRTDDPGRGPMGPTRSQPTKPVIAAIEGHAVAGGLELALWCDLRIVAASAILGVFCRRVGVPLIDGGTARLPRIVGQGRALDLILTGRAVDADEAVAIGLATRQVPDGRALSAAIELAGELSALPQITMRSDLGAARRAFDRDLSGALRAEHEAGTAAIAAGGLDDGVRRFQAGEGRGGSALGPPAR